MLEIPVSPNISSDFSLSIALDNVECEFRFIWNTKTKFWMVNTFKETNSGKILNGLKIIPNYPFLAHYNTSLPGEIIALKIGRDVDSEITYNNFGDGWNLYYLTEEEFESWSEANGF